MESSAMWYPVERAPVSYGCSCGQRKPLTHLYFCRHCLALRCPYCISHEVDSLYCAHCLENMPTAEARHKKNRCGSCSECPSCFHTLSPRATSVAQARTSSKEDPKSEQKEETKPDPKSDPKAPKKMYYLSCFNCRWTSRDVGIPDQPVPAGAWPDQMSVHSQRIERLYSHYKSLAMFEAQHKIERERRKLAATGPGNFLTLTDKIGLSFAMARVRVSGSTVINMNMNEAKSKITSAEATAEVNDLPDDIFTKEINLKYITNMEQRLAQPEFQPTTVEKLFPSLKQFFIKRSQRCRQCDHNVTKPEYNPGSIKFKIQLFAYYHIPEIRIISCEPLKAGQSSHLILKLSNPTGHDTTIKFKQYDAEAADSSSHEVKVEGEELKLKAQEMDNKFAKMDINNTAKIVLPTDSLSLPLRDDASEYIEDTQNFNDDPKVVAWRKSNKLAMNAEVIPDESLSVGDDVCATFSLSFTYTNTVASAPRLPSTHNIHLQVYLQLGKIVN